MRPLRHNLVEIAFHTGTSPEELEGRDAIEGERIKEAEAAFRNALEGLLLEDIESIHNYIRFVRAERRRQGRGGR